MITFYLKSISPNKVLETIGTKCGIVGERRTVEFNMS